MTDQPAIKLANIIEAALLASSKPLNLDQIRQLFPEKAEPAKEEIQQALADISAACEGRSFELKEVASGYRLQIRQEMAPWVGKLWEEKPQRYTRALLETLALVAYRQPVTRAEIEEIRGVSVSSSIMKTLLEREWVRIVGYRDVPGRPAMYATTRQFLDYFNLANLDELPPLSELQDIEKANQELALEEGEEAVTTVKADLSTSEGSSGEDNTAIEEVEVVDEEVLFQEIDEMQKGLPEDFIDPAKLDPDELAALEAQQSASEDEEESAEEGHDDLSNEVLQQETPEIQQKLLNDVLATDATEATQVSEELNTTDDVSSVDQAIIIEHVSEHSPVEDELPTNEAVVELTEQQQEDTAAELDSVFNNEALAEPVDFVSVAEVEQFDEQIIELVMESDTADDNEAQTSSDMAADEGDQLEFADAEMDDLPSLFNDLSIDQTIPPNISTEADRLEPSIDMAEQTAVTIDEVDVNDLPEADQAKDIDEPADHTAADVLATELLTSSADTIIPSIFQDEDESEQVQSDDSLTSNSSDIQQDS